MHRKGLKRTLPQNSCEVPPAKRPRLSPSATIVTGLLEQNHSESARVDSQGGATPSELPTRLQSELEAKRSSPSAEHAHKSASVLRSYCSRPTEGVASEDPVPRDMNPVKPNEYPLVLFKEPLKMNAEKNSFSVPEEIDMKQTMQNAERSIPQCFPMSVSSLNAISEPEKVELVMDPKASIDADGIAFLKHHVEVLNKYLRNYRSDHNMTDSMMEAGLLLEVTEKRSRSIDQQTSALLATGKCEKCSSQNYSEMVSRNLPSPQHGDQTIEWDQMISYSKRSFRQKATEVHVFDYNPVILSYKQNGDRNVCAQSNNENSKDCDLRDTPETFPESISFDSNGSDSTCRENNENNATRIIGQKSNNIKGSNNTLDNRDDTENHKKTFEIEILQFKQDLMSSKRGKDTEGSSDDWLHSTHSASGENVDDSYSTKTLNETCSTRENVHQQPIMDSNEFLRLLVALFDGNLSKMLNEPMDYESDQTEFSEDGKEKDDVSKNDEED